jgi:hypothetical protein
MECPKELILALPAAQISSFVMGSQDFTIIYKTQRFQVNSVVASGLSKRLFYLLRSDPLCTEFTYDTRLSGDFSPVQSFLNLEPITVQRDASLFLFQVAAELQIDGLAEKVADSIDEVKVLENVFDIIFPLYESGVACALVLAILASHFEALDLNGLKGLPPPLLDQLFRSPSLILRNKQLFVQFIRSLFDWTETPNHRLVKHLPFAAMEDQDVIAILNHPKLNLNTLRYALLRCPTGKQ